MDHGGYLLFGEDAIQQCRVTYVPLIEEGGTPADGGDAGQHAHLAVAEIIHHHRLNPSGLQGQAGVAANIAATTGDQYFHPLLHAEKSL